MLKPKAMCLRGDGEAEVPRFCLILLAVMLGSSQLRSQDRTSLSPIAIILPRGNLSPEPHKVLVQEPYCELGYGTCGGQCSEAGKKPWDCPSQALPCYQRGQHCTCEEADICKPKKKRSELSLPAAPAQTSHSAAPGANPAPPHARPPDTPDTDQWRRVLSRLGL
jgi:hypothetical protein